MNLSTILKYLPYLTAISDVVAKFKSGGTGQTTVTQIPGSIDGHKGEFILGFVPDSDVVAVAALHDLEGVSLDL